MGDTSGNGMMYWIAILVTLCPSIAAGARRLHDVNKSGWWQLIAITIIGIIPLVIWMATEGAKKKNKYGQLPGYPPSSRASQAWHPPIFQYRKWRH